MVFDICWLLVVGWVCDMVSFPRVSVAFKLSTLGIFFVVQILLRRAFVAWSCCMWQLGMKKFLDFMDSILILNPLQDYTWKNHIEN